MHQLLVFVIAPPAVIADLIRNPVYAWHWIPDQVRDDKFGFKVHVQF